MIGKALVMIGKELALARIIDKVLCIAKVGDRVLNFLVFNWTVDTC